VASGIPFDVLWDEDFETGIEIQYDLIVFPDCHAMTRPTHDYLKNYISSGGSVVVDEQCRVDLSGTIKLGGSPKTNNLADKEAQLLNKYENRTEHPQYVEAMQELVKQQEATKNDPRLEELLRKIRTKLRCESANVCWNLLAAEDAQYLVAVNDLRIPGRTYGRYGKVREQGIAQNVSFVLQDKSWNYAYDLTAGKPLAINASKLVFPLSPCAGRIVMLTARPVGALAISLPTELAPGRIAHVKVSSTGFSEGLLPVKIELIRPDGQSSSLSRFSVLQRGLLDLELPLAVNAPHGKWTLRVTCLATSAASETDFIL
jgi:hypothetical protein